MGDEVQEWPFTGELMLTGRTHLLQQVKTPPTKGHMQSAAKSLSENDIYTPCKQFKLWGSFPALVCPLNRPRASHWSQEIALTFQETAEHTDKLTKLWFLSPTVIGTLQRSVTWLLYDSLLPLGCGKDYSGARLLGDTMLLLSEQQRETGPC